MVKSALDDLLKDAPILAGMKFVHWFDREIAQEEDPFCTLDFGFDRSEQAPETVPVKPGPLSGTWQTRSLKASIPVRRLRIWTARPITSCFFPA